MYKNEKVAMWEWVTECVSVVGEWVIQTNQFCWGKWIERECFTSLELSFSIITDGNMCESEVTERATKRLGRISSPRHYSNSGHHEYKTNDLSAKTAAFEE